MRQATTPTAKEAAAAASPRRPLQERGQRRVDAILDAAAAIIAEGGMSAATMHAIAKRSGTTTGSMYHFFPDVTYVVEALTERHERGIRSLTEALDAAAIDWAALPTRAAVDRLVDPLLDYLETHPDLLEVIRHGRAPSRAARDSGIDAVRLELTRRVVAGRHPALSTAEQTARAATVLAVIDGVVRRAVAVPMPPRRTMLRELKAVLVAYLDAAPGSP